MMLNESPAPPPPSPLVAFEMCDIHDRELRMALSMRGMDRYLELSEEEQRELHQLGRGDPLNLSLLQLSLCALRTFSIEHIQANQRCPVCAFQSIVTVMADAMALQFTKGH